MNRAHTTGHCVHGKAVLAGESKWGYGRLSRNKSIGLRFRVKIEDLWEICEGVWILFREQWRPMSVQKPKVKAEPYQFRLTKILTLRRRDCCKISVGIQVRGLRAYLRRRGAVQQQRNGRNKH